MNLFAGIVVEKFNQEKSKAQGTADLEDIQLEWINMR